MNTFLRTLREQMGGFGATSGGLASVVEKLFASYGLPNGYVLGEEGSGAFVGGLTYGEGILYTKNAGDHTVFWQGPSVGWDFGGQRVYRPTHQLFFSSPASCSSAASR